MRIAKWDWSQANKIVTKNTYARALKAANLLANEIRNVCPVGTISHPMYSKGKFAGQTWTKRDGGSLKKSVRVTEKKEKDGFDVMEFAGLGIIGGPRVYIGNYFAWYAAIVEHYTPFIRQTAVRMQGQIKHILENG